MKPRKDGRYPVSVRINGQRLWRYGKTPREADRLRRELLAAKDAGLHPSRQLLADYLRGWIASHGPRLAPTTRKRYTEIIEQHLVPALGRHRLSSLSEQRVQAFLDGDPASPRTRVHFRGVLRAALNVAVRQHMIPYNPAIAVSLPDATWTGDKPLTVDEAKALFAATNGTWLGPLWRLAVETGFREAELTGLRWEDIDFAAGTISISTQLQRIGGQWVRRPTKAARKVETISISSTMTTLLRAHQVEHARQRRPDWRYWDLVFVTKTGQPYHGGQLLRSFAVACDHAGIPRRRFHDLRHTSATIMRSLGISMEDRKQRLGHSSDAMAERYAHTVNDRHIADKLQEALG